MKNISENSMLSIMQPYFFPYIGYFHLINSSDLIIFYDDVTYIKQGWINRNSILYNNATLLFTVPINKQSSFKLIKDTMVDKNIFPIWKNKFLKTLKNSYSKAPYFELCYELISSVLDTDVESISDLSIMSITSVYRYLGLEIKHHKSSVISPNSKGMDKVDRLVKITKDLGFNKYVNPSGGRDLYSKKTFKQRDIDLYFVKSLPCTYKQFNSHHISGLSIIDVLMFLDKNEIIDMFSSYNVE